MRIWCQDDSRFQSSLRLRNRFFAKENMCLLRIIANILDRGGSDLFYGEIKTELGLLAQSLVLSSTSQISAEELSSQSLCVLQETAAQIFLFYLFLYVKQ